MRCIRCPNFLILLSRTFSIYSLFLYLFRPRFGFLFQLAEDSLMHLLWDCLPWDWRKIRRTVSALTFSRSPKGKVPMRKKKFSHKFQYNRSLLAQAIKHQTFVENVILSLFTLRVGGKVKDGSKWILRSHSLSLSLCVCVSVCLLTCVGVWMAHILYDVLFMMMIFMVDSQSWQQKWTTVRATRFCFAKEIHSASDIYNSDRCSIKVVQSSI